VKFTGNRTGKDRGFSLMELLVALVILSLIMGIVGPRVIGYLNRAKSQTAEVQIENIKSALNLYLLDMGHYPDTDQGLIALVEDPGGADTWLGPYLMDGELPDDPWGRPYQYELDKGGSKAIVFTYGRDGSEGGSGEDKDIGRPPSQ